MTEHTPTPWNAATAYSSICGVPIINQKGQRVGNTALPDMPKEWEELKQRAVADAAFICKAVNSHEAMVKALEKVRSYNVDIAAGRINYRPHDHIQVIDEALAVLLHNSGGEK